MTADTHTGRDAGARSIGDAAEGDFVALKILKKRYADCADDEIAVFEKLAQGAESCRSIVRLHEHFTVEGHVCLAFEMHGVPLYDIVEEAPLAIGEVKSITREIARALEELHGLGFAHTDLKTDNILYEEGLAKLIDFSTADDALRKGETFGTREYRAPEAILGCDLGPEVDIWSFGCTVFELLTRDYLFDPHGSLWARRQRTGKGQDEWDRMKRAVASGDASAEEEEFGEGSEVGGKYRLEAELGEGHFSKVWKARVLTGAPATGEVLRVAPVPSADNDEDEVEEEDSVSKESSQGEAMSRKERRELAYRYDVVLDRELLRIVEGTLGEIPRAYGREGKYYARFFTESGTLKMEEPVDPKSIREVLIDVYRFDPDAATEIERFLLPMLNYDPSRRPSAAAILEDPWLKE